MGAANSGGSSFAGMFDGVLGLVTGVPVVFVDEQLIAFAAMHTSAQSPTLIPTEPAPNTEPGTTPTNDANRPPPSPSPSSLCTNSALLDSGMNTTTRNRHYPYSRPTTPRPTGVRMPLRSTAPTPNARGKQDPPTSHAKSSGNHVVRSTGTPLVRLARRRQLALLCHAIRPCCTSLASGVPITHHPSLAYRPICV